MALETGTYVNDLVVTNPVGATDERRFGDDHLRLIKTVLKNTFPNASRPFGFPITESRASNTELVVADSGKCIVATAAFTQTFAAAATLGNGWFVEIRNNTASGIVVLDPTGAETIGGLATFQVYAGEHVKVVCDGSTFSVLGASGRVLLSTATASGSSALSFLNIGPNALRFKAFEFTFSAVIPVASGASLYAQPSSDNGSSWATSNTSHVRHGGAFGGTATLDGSNSDPLGALMAILQSNSHISGIQGLARLGTTGSFNWQLGYVSSVGNIAVLNGYSVLFGNTNAVRFLYTGGNIASGTIRCYGMV